MINAVLSGGPVGPGDRVNVTDAVMTLRACDANGRILRKRTYRFECPRWFSPPPHLGYHVAAMRELSGS